MLMSCTTLPGIAASEGKGVRRDEEVRFSNLVLPHLADCFALARWITGNSADAEDVVQDACLRAFRAIDGYAGGNARAWVLTIVRNAASILGSRKTDQSRSSLSTNSKPRVSERRVLQAWRDPVRLPRKRS